MRAERVRGPLTWAQHGQWLQHFDLPPGQRWRRNVLIHCAAPPGTKRDDLARAATVLVGRHTALRTRFLVDERDTVVQEVLDPDDPPLAGCDVSANADPIAAAHDFVGELLRCDFDIRTGPPVRFGVVSDGDVPRWFVLVTHHIAVDWISVTTLRSELLGVLDDLVQGRDPDPRPIAAQPLAQARFEASPAGRTMRDRSFAHWTRLADELPATSFPVVATPQPGARRLAEAALRTERAAQACDTLVRRHGMPESVLLFAAFTALLARFTGNERVVLRMIASNRFHRDLMPMVGCLVQILPVPVDVRRADPWDGFVRQVQRATGAVYRHGRYDAAQVAELMTTRQFHRGAQLLRMPAYNYLSVPASQTPRRPAASAEPPQESEYRWAENDTHIAAPVCLKVARAPDVIDLSVLYDVAVVGAADAEAFVRSVEALVSAAAARTGATVGDLLEMTPMAEPVRDTDWHRVGGCWTNLAEVTRLLREHPAVDDAVVLTDAAGLTARVSVHVAVSPFDLRCFVLARMFERPSCVVPDRFEIFDARASEPWHPGGLQAAGDGREPDATATAHPACARLADAFAGADCGVRRPWRGLPYLVAGGRVTATTRVLAELERAGDGGLRYSDLLGFTPGNGLAERLAAGDGRS